MGMTEEGWKNRAECELANARELYERMTGHHTTELTVNDRDEGHVFITIFDCDESNEDGNCIMEVVRFRAKGWEEMSRQMESVRRAYQSLWEVIGRKWQ